MRVPKAAAFHEGKSKEMTWVKGEGKQDDRKEERARCRKQLVVGAAPLLLDRSLT